MIKEKILKLAKGMVKFHIDELTMILNKNKKEIDKYLFELIKEGVLEKIENEIYLYKGTNCTIKNLYEIIIPDFNNLKGFTVKVDDKDFLDKYKKAPFWIKKKAYKYLLLLKETNCITGKKLKAFIKDWNREHIELKTNPTSIYRIRNIVEKYGSSGLLLYACNHRKSIIIDQELYNTFKDLYLKREAPSLKSCIEKLRKDYFKNNTKMLKEEFPDNYWFIYKLKKDYSDIEIKAFRSKKTIQEPENFKKYKNIVQMYLDSEDFQSRSKRAQLLYLSYLNNHLIPYFGEFEIKDMTSDSIKEFEKYKFEQGFKETTIKYFIIALKTAVCYHYKFITGLYEHLNNCKL
jgi:hypothetical protein